MIERSRQDILNKKETGKMCLSDGNELDEMCSVEDDDTCGDGCSFVPTKPDDTIEIDLDLNGLMLPVPS